jgi:REP element-mobilizing transposase RayT
MVPRRRPDYCKGRFYHFYNRGAHRVSLFREPDNYTFVLRKVKKHARTLDLSVIAYCLMPNHYHLVVRQDAEHAARRPDAVGVQQLQQGVQQALRSQRHAV